jgi:hypothetical protein
MLTEFGSSWSSLPNSFGPRVIAFLAGHRPDNRHLVHGASEARQVLANANPRHAGSDFLEWTTIGVARFQVECVDLAWTAAHPEQDARLFALRMRGQIVGEQVKPAGERRTHGAG